MVDSVLDRVIRSEYDLANRPCRKTTTTSAGTPIYEAQVEYDQCGNLCKFQETVAGTETHTTSFTYGKVLVGCDRKISPLGLRRDFVDGLRPSARRPLWVGIQFCPSTANRSRAEAVTSGDALPPKGGSGHPRQK